MRRAEPKRLHETTHLHDVNSTFEQIALIAQFVKPNGGPRPTHLNEYRHALEKILWVHEPAIFGRAVHAAQVYAMLGRKQEAAAEPEKLRR